MKPFTVLQLSYSNKKTVTADVVACQYMIFKGVAFTSVYITKHSEGKHIQTCGMMLKFFLNIALSP